MNRQVEGLRWARRLPTDWPQGIPKSRPRGIKAFGSRYEAAVGKALPCAERALWWEFFDANGPGLCQTDFILSPPKAGDSQWPMVVLECKHTWTEDGMFALTGLYAPVVAMATGLPVLRILVCKHLVPWDGKFWRDRLYSSLDDAIEGALAWGTPTTLHWRGMTPLQLPPPKAGYQAKIGQTNQRSLVA